jgi:hypothetical protein
MGEVTMIDLHSRVALKDGADSVYAFALAGTEGWVREVKEDEHGFEMVKVEWDKDHWRYNGQPDGWTFASHFKVVGPPEEPALEEEEEAPLPPGIEFIAETPDEISMNTAPASEEQVDRYMEAISEAMEAASESEGFMMIAIRRVPDPENPGVTNYIPTIIMSALSQQAALLLDIQLAECASSSYEEMVMQLIEQLKRQSNDGNS